MSDPNKCIFCGRDIEFVCMIRGVCVPCHDALQMKGYMLLTKEQFAYFSKFEESAKVMKQCLEKIQNDAYLGATFMDRPVVDSPKDS